MQCIRFSSLLHFPLFPPSLTFAGNQRKVTQWTQRALLITDAETVVICACVKAELLSASSTIYIAAIIWSSSSADTQKKEENTRRGGPWRNFTQPLCELLMGPEWQSGKQLSLSFTETSACLYPILCSQALVGTVFCQQPVFQGFPGSPISITALIGRADWD